MKGKQLVVILILLAVVGGAGIFWYNRTTESWKTASGPAGNKKLVDFPINDIAQVTIKDRGAETNVVRAEDGWKVKERHNYPADFEAISSLLRKLWELRPVQEVEAGPSQFARLELNMPEQGTTNSGVLIQLKDGQGKQVAGMLLGKNYLRQADVPMAPNGIPAGRYIKPEDGSNRVVLVSDTFSEVEAKPEHWLDRTFFKIENPKSISLSSPTPDLNWTVARNAASDGWTLRDSKPGEQFDAAKFSSVTASLASPALADVLAADTSAAETGLDQPTTVAVETFDNFAYTIRFGKPMADKYPLTVAVTAQLPKERVPASDEKPEDKARLDQEFQAKQKQLSEKLAAEQKLNNQIFLVAKTTLDQVAKPRSALMADKPSPSPAPSVSPGTKSPAPAQSPTRNTRAGRSPAKPKGQ
ncbi:MAG TPA: DUF4340 domain-containing protein [Chthoniobacterales bacterium]|nr:DUF4340 domain-containing protein [Chthoniobacterales bacterium]